MGMRPVDMLVVVVVVVVVVRVVVGQLCLLTL
jgi:hypothetical protein